MRRISLLLVGCASYASQGRSVAPSDIGSEGARITNFMTLKRDNNTQPETAPQGIPRDAVQDEATLALLDGSRACVDITLRTPAVFDRPLSAWTFKLDDDDVTPEHETVTVRDYTGAQSVVLAEAVSLTELASLAITAPSKDVYRVMERSARLCGAPAKSLALIAELDPRDGSTWGVQFRWEVR